LNQHGKSLKDECDFTIVAGNVADLIIIIFNPRKNEGKKKNLETEKC